MPRQEGVALHDFAPDSPRQWRWFGAGNRHAGAGLFGPGAGRLSSLTLHPAGALGALRGGAARGPAARGLAHTCCALIYAPRSNIVLGRAGASTLGRARTAQR